MTDTQWLGVILIAMVFFGSLAIGRYLRWRDEKWMRKPSPRSSLWQKTLERKRQNAMVVHGRLKTYSTPPEKLERDLAIDLYHAEVERLARGYHGLAVAEGEEMAQQWLHNQLGID